MQHTFVTPYSSVCVSHSYSGDPCLCLLFSHLTHSPRHLSLSIYFYLISSHLCALCLYPLSSIAIPIYLLHPRQKLNGNCTVSVTAPDLNFVSDLSSLTINSKEQLAYASVISWSLQTTTGVQTVVNSKSEFVRV